MHFIIVNTDREDGVELRAETRDAHLEYLRNHGKNAKLVHAGPTPSEDGSRMTGSLLVVEAESIDDARALAEDDPYTKAGLFASTDVRPWMWTMGNPDGGH